MSAKLILSYDDTLIGDFTLTKETTTVGRKPENDIHINDRAVSGHHSRIITILNNSFLEDLGSTNGTYVNGRVTHKTALQHGDIVKIGNHELKYHNGAATGQDDFEKTMVIRPDAIAEATAGAAAPPPFAPLGGSPATSKPALKAALEVLGGSNAGKELRLTKALTTVGKPGVQVAAITRRPTGYFLISVAGGRGKNRQPMVNDQPIGASAHKLRPNDVIEVAGVQMKFSARD
jgi:pSer/pThr/pTyr-binding forkhead associated (FHA) protein